jgi:hypothetical protein
MVFPQSNIFLATLCSTQGTQGRKESEFRRKLMIIQSDCLLQKLSWNLRSVSERLSFFKQIQTGQYVSV